ncbi:MAG: VCBS repeat-containing protein [Planctomycetaceae bacterium]
MRWIPVCVICISLPVAADEAIQFQAQVIDDNVGRVCYAVTTADVNGDGRRDIVGLTENRVIWYENPSWEPHVILEDQTPADNVCIAPYDIDGDGQIDFALGAGWTKIGTLHWISRKPDPQEKWTVHAIGEERSTHRMRFADVLGTGKPQLVVSPLLATSGKGARLLAFEIPANPATDRWKETVLNADMNRMHNHWHADINHDGHIDTLTASREGLHLVQRGANGFTAERLSSGATADELDQNGSGEVRFGRIKEKGLIATVEPMHGHSVVTYSPSADGWQREVVDTGFQRGHAISLTDLNGDGSDEIIFGHSDTPGTFGVIVYHSPATPGDKWQRIVVDAGGMATEDLLVEDLTGDGRPDIVAGGRASHNIKLYVQK